MKDGFLCFSPGVGPKLVFGMSRVRGKGSLAMAITHRKIGRPRTGWQVTTVSSAMRGLKNGSKEASRRGWLRP